MMLRYSFGQDEAAAAIDKAVEGTLEKGICTADIAVDRQRQSALPRWAMPLSRRRMTEDGGGAVLHLIRKAG
jgi:isocitrate/isopropylmalate dehydrogenase